MIALLLLLLLAVVALKAHGDVDWRFRFADDDYDDEDDGDKHHEKDKKDDCHFKKPKKEPCAPKPVKSYDYVVVGQGAGGIMTEYFLSQALKEVAPHKKVSIAAFEANGDIGGVVRAAKLKKPAGYDNSFGTELYGDMGAQRTTQMTLGMKRRMVHELGLQMMYTPFKGEHNSRGLRKVCNDPTERAFAERADTADDGSTPALFDNAFIYGSLCLQDPFYVGNAADEGVPQVDGTPEPVFPGLHNLAVGNNDAPSDNAYGWLLEGAQFEVLADEPDLTSPVNGDCYSFSCDNSTNPITGETCCNPGDRECPFEVAYKEDVRTHVARQLSFNQAGYPVLNYNYSEFMMEDNVGFLGDYRRQFGARSYYDYQIREWGSTNGINGYIPGGERRFVRGMWNVARVNGLDTFLDEPVRKIDIVESGPYKFRVETEKQVVLVRKHLFLNLPPFYLFPRDATTKQPWPGRLLQGTLVDALRQVDELKHPDPQDVVRVLLQWEPGTPAWFWELFNDAGNHSYRQMGSTGCFSRTEFIDTPYHRCTNHIVPVYTDDLCERIWLGHFEEWKLTGDDATLTRRAVDEMKTSFPHLAHKIDDPVLVAFEKFPSAWHWGKRPYDNITNAEVTRKAADPLNGLAVSLVAEAYAVSWQGWMEAPARSSKRALLRHAAEVGGPLGAAITQRFTDLFNVFLDASAGNTVSDASSCSNFAYTPPLYYNPDPALMLSNERWWPYGPYDDPVRFPTPADYCKASKYNLQPFTE